MTETAFFPFPQARQAQKEALSDKVQTMDSEQAGNTIFQVLQQRHTQEKVEAEERYAREVEIAKAEARAQAEEARQTARDQLIGEQEQVAHFIIIAESKRRFAFSLQC